MVSSGMNPMIGCTIDTSPRLSAAERQSMPPTSLGMTIANARQKVGVGVGKGPASIDATASSTPPTVRNATVDTTTPASPTARLSRRLVPAEATAAISARTIHMDELARRQCVDDPLVAVGRGVQLRDLHVLVVAMRDMDGAWPEQVGRAPRRHGGDVRRERDHRRRESVERTEPHRRDLDAALERGSPCRPALESRPYFVGGSDD